jgi:hypothetical protein
LINCERLAAPLYYLSAGFGPSNCFFWASSAYILFECGLRSLKSLLSGQLRLFIIRVRASVPQIVSFGPAAPLYYLSAGFGPSNCFLLANSASLLFEFGFWSLELFLSGQQRLYIIRVRASVPRIASFGPATPLYYLSARFGPSNLLLSGQQRLYIIRVWASVPRIASLDQQRLFIIRVRVLVPRIT